MDPELEPVSAADAPVAAPAAAAEAGFTLIELLVSIAILAVLALGLALSLPRSSSGDSDMARFQRQFDSLRQRAIAGQHTLGLVVNARGMRQARRESTPQQGTQNQGWHKQGWQISKQEQRWHGVVRFDATGTTAGARRSSGAQIPQIQVLGDGRSSAFVIRFSPRASGAPGGSCRSDGWTGLRCEAS